MKWTTDCVSHIDMIQAETWEKSIDLPQADYVVQAVPKPTVMRDLGD